MTRSIDHIEDTWNNINTKEDIMKQKERITEGEGSCIEGQRPPKRRRLLEVPQPSSSLGETSQSPEEQIQKQLSNFREKLQEAKENRDSQGYLLARGRIWFAEKKARRDII